MKTFEQYLEENLTEIKGKPFKIEDRKIMRWTVRHGDEKVTTFKSNEEDKAQALFDKVSKDPKLGKKASISAQDQAGIDIPGNVLKSLKKKNATIHDNDGNVK